MSYFPEDSMGYFDTIQVFFMELTGRSLIFSGRDLQLLYQWRTQGATARLICQGVDDAIKAMPETEPPRDIYSCRGYIETQLQRVRKSIGSVASLQNQNSSASRPESQNTTPDMLASSLEKVESLGRRCEDESLKSIYRTVWQDLRHLGQSDHDDSELLEALMTIEEAFLDRYFAMLPESTQKSIEHQIFQESLPYLARMSDEARAQHLTARRRLLLKRSNYGIQSFLD